MAGRRIAQGGEGGEGGVDGEVSLGHADLAARRTPRRCAWRGPPDDACPGEGFAVSSHTPQNKELPVQFAFGSFCQPPQDCAAFPVSPWERRAAGASVRCLAVRHLYFLIALPRVRPRNGLASSPPRKGRGGNMLSVGSGGRAGPCVQALPLVSHLLTLAIPLAAVPLRDEPACHGSCECPGASGRVIPDLHRLARSAGSRR